jgi:hypothetical protein
VPILEDAVDVGLAVADAGLEAAREPLEGDELEFLAAGPLPEAAVAVGEVPERNGDQGKL